MCKNVRGIACLRAQCTLEWRVKGFRQLFGHTDTSSYDRCQNTIFFHLCLVEARTNNQEDKFYYDKIVFLIKHIIFLSMNSGLMVPVACRFASMRVLLLFRFGQGHRKPVI
jgi:hypothetical protein